jgi:hypothetical protein
VNNFSERFGTLRDAFGLLFRRRFRFLKVLGVNQDDQASEWQEKIETTPELLAELKDKARQRGLSLFAYLAHFVNQDNEDIRQKNPLSGGLRKRTPRLTRMKLLRFGGHGSSENESQFSQFEILIPENKFSPA